MKDYVIKPNIGKRFLAGLIDYSLNFLFFYVFVFTVGTSNDEGATVVTGWLALVPIVFWFVTVVLFEAFFGAGLGNSIVGLKPVSIRNHSGELSFGQSIKRHLMDPIDMLLLGFVGYLAIINTNKHQRLGDLWANTIVIEANKN